LFCGSKFIDDNDDDDKEKQREYLAKLFIEFMFVDFSIG
jgi:hypothetical protein